MVMTVKGVLVTAATFITKVQEKKAIPMRESFTALLQVMVNFPWFSSWFVIMTLNNASSYFVYVIHPQALISQKLFLYVPHVLPLRPTDVKSVWLCLRGTLTAKFLFYTMF